ncbi:MAG: peptidase C45 [Thermoleophilia bacterium]|nr:peptidase C45 [Thermoleophilia bacterium]
MSGVTYPHVRVAGGPRERGRQYGEQARERVRRSVEAYGKVYEDLAGLSWGEALTLAGEYADAIDRFEPRYLEEMRGLAEGSGQTLEAVLAINVRTEIMFAAKAREAAAAPRAAQAGQRPRPPGECTSIAALPSVTDSGHTLLAQNWDWLPHTRDTLVVLEAEQDEGPAYVTAVEAGLLAKAGFNARGVAVATNALVSDADAGEVGVPYHVCLRALLDAEHLPAALAALQRARRSSSANYMLAHVSGLAIDVEGVPGDCSGLRLVDPADGLLVHTNHFTTAGVHDVGLWWMPDSPFRLQRARTLLAEREGPVTVSLLETVFADHTNHPVGICAHADPRDKSTEQGETIVSLIMDLDEQVMWLADGTPCSVPYRRLEYAGFFGVGA